MDLCMKCSLARVEYSVGKHGVYLSDYSQQLEEMADCKAREFKSKKTQYLKGDCSTTNKVATNQKIMATVLQISQ